MGYVGLLLSDKERAALLAAELELETKAESVAATKQAREQAAPPGGPEPEEKASRRAGGDTAPGQEEGQALKEGGRGERRR